MPLRYQLLHRTASAILEAQRYRTNIAALLVHSFAKDHEGFADFSAFLQAVGFDAPTYGVLVGPVVRGGVSVYAGWVEDKPQNSPDVGLSRRPTCLYDAHSRRLRPRSCMVRRAAIEAPNRNLIEQAGD
jgi:hypothetical protein